MKQAHIFISGFVQGVGYRRFIKYHAKKLGVTGFIKNLPDDRVEAVLQPSASSGQEGEERVKKLMHVCNRGPFLSEVKNVAVEWENVEEEYTEFKILKYF